MIIQLPQYTQPKLFYQHFNKDCIFGPLCHWTLLSLSPQKQPIDGPLSAPASQWQTNVILRQTMKIKERGDLFVRDWFWIFQSNLRIRKRQEKPSPRILLSSKADVYPQKSISKFKTQGLERRDTPTGKGQQRSMTVLPPMRNYLSTVICVFLLRIIRLILMGEKLYQSKRKYCKISYQKRLRLIDLVENQKMGVTRAAKKLRIKIPTAKVILSTFRRRGQVFKKKGEECPQQQPKRSLPQVEALQAEPEPVASAEMLEEEKRTEWSEWMYYYPVFYFVRMTAEGGVINF